MGLFGKLFGVAKKIATAPARGFVKGAKFGLKNQAAGVLSRAVRGKKIFNPKQGIWQDYKDVVAGNIKAASAVLAAKSIGNMSSGPVKVPELRLPKVGNILKGINMKGFGGIKTAFDPGRDIQGFLGGVFGGERPPVSGGVTFGDAQKKYALPFLVIVGIVIIALSRPFSTKSGRR